MSRGGAKFGRVSASSLKSVKDARKYLTSNAKILLKHTKLDLDEVAWEALMQAMREVPERTGALAASVSIVVSKDKRRPGLLGTAFAIDPITGEEYATIQHEEYPFKRKKGAKMQFIADPIARAGEKLKGKVEDLMEEIFFG